MHTLYSPHCSPNIFYSTHVENLFNNQDLFHLLIISFFSHDLHVWLSSDTILGEIKCWSLLGGKGLTNLSIECMKQRVACSVSHSTASVSLTSLTVIITLTTKCTLINLTLFCATERHSIVFELQKWNWHSRLSCHKNALDGFHSTLEQ